MDDLTPLLLPPSLPSPHSSDSDLFYGSSSSSESSKSLASSELLDSLKPPGSPNSLKAERLGLTLYQTWQSDSWRAEAERARTVETATQILPFLRLSMECRNMIYKLHCVWSPYTVNEISCSVILSHTPLLRVSKQVRKEAMDIFCRLNVFALTSTLTVNSDNGYQPYDQRLRSLHGFQANLWTFKIPTGDLGKNIKHLRIHLPIDELSDKWIVFPALKKCGFDILESLTIIDKQRNEVVDLERNTCSLISVYDPSIERKLLRGIRIRTGGLVLKNVGYTDGFKLDAYRHHRPNQTIESDALLNFLHIDISLDICASGMGQGSRLSQGERRKSNETVGVAMSILMGPDEGAEDEASREIAHIFDTPRFGFIGRIYRDNIV
ncbi:hypothetical protein EJ05DRAFT_527882 [Pseudovirgaria hyperparasitica]|uniref:F-box domain-containing protein n=1 Tax=Pseudovirgaria hyperparasitica TaxID=470096 RepID=A0A6A6W7L5_9PEZI|nr:uncharacterized protein EJ05DRAFT_527882 [Pseudovirgaria hyperparasitica]KAF2758535.1 hypothetical protein EJ05DRAFT_527882 [Pseudovirgaria hyperparasitica]